MSASDTLPETVTCRYCGGVAKLEWRKKLIASPIGSFSLSGVQVKVSAINVDWPWMVCTGCGHESEGKSE